MIESKCTGWRWVSLLELSGVSFVRRSYCFAPAADLVANLCEQVGVAHVDDVTSNV